MARRDFEGNKSKAQKCSVCSSELKVVEYLEAGCEFYFKLACQKCDDKNNKIEEEVLIQVAKPLTNSSLCPNCLCGLLKQSSCNRKSLGLVCDTCNRFISFGYSVSGKKIVSLGLSP